MASSRRPVTVDRSHVRRTAVPASASILATAASFQPAAGGTAPVELAGEWLGKEEVAQERRRARRYWPRSPCRARTRAPDRPRPVRRRQIRQPVDERPAMRDARRWAGPGSARTSTGSAHTPAAGAAGAMLHGGGFGGTAPVLRQYSGMTPQNAQLRPSRRPGGAGETPGGVLRPGHPAECARQAAANRPISVGFLPTVDGEYPPGRGPMRRTRWHPDPGRPSPVSSPSSLPPVLTPAPR